MVARNPRLSYGYEKLMIAVDTLATGDNPLPRRLADAYIYNLMHLDPENLPSMAAWQRLKEVDAALTSAPDEGEGTVHATVAHMGSENAASIAGKVLDLYYDAAREHFRDRE